MNQIFGVGTYRAVSLRFGYSTTMDISWHFDRKRWTYKALNSRCSTASPYFLKGTPRDSPTTDLWGAKIHSDRLRQEKLGLPRRETENGFLFRFGSRMIGSGFEHLSQSPWLTIFFGCQTFLHVPFFPEFQKQTTVKSSCKDTKRIEELFHPLSYPKQLNINCNTRTMHIFPTLDEI